jgi:hypothetical protein
VYSSWKTTPPPLNCWSTAGASTLTTTYHHQFYDRTQAAFVEAANLHIGDELQTPTGVTVITALHPHHDTQVTYDLTINNIHTYYVEAGKTPVLVHNVNTPIGCRPHGEPVYGIPEGGPFPIL